MLSCPLFVPTIDAELRTTMKHPLHGKRMSEVNVKEVQALNPLDFVSYTNWVVQARLNYLIAEGFVEVLFDEENVPSYKCLQPDGTHILLSETEAEDSLLETLLLGLGRYI